MPNLQEEPIYGSKFKLEPIAEAFLDMMEKVMPDKAAGEEIFHPRENPFMPKKALVSKKVEEDMPPALIS